MTVHAHFDGKVLVPDEPLDLPPNQPVIVDIRPVNGAPPDSEESATAWIAANAVDTDVLPADLSDRHDFYLYGTPDAER
jgi:hypothetical protein